MTSWFVSLNHCSTSTNQCLMLFYFPGYIYDGQAVKFKTKWSIVIIRRSFSIVNYSTRELLRKKLLRNFSFWPPNSRPQIGLLHSRKGLFINDLSRFNSQIRIKVTYYCGLTWSVLFSCIVINLQWCLLNWNLRDCTLEVSMWEPNCVTSLFVTCKGNAFPLKTCSVDSSNLGL